MNIYIYIYIYIYIDLCIYTCAYIEREITESTSQNRNRPIINWLYTWRENNGPFCSQSGMPSHTALGKIDLSQTATIARLVQVEARARTKLQRVDRHMWTMHAHAYASHISTLRCPTDACCQDSPLTS